jgi:acyl carrier protein
MDIETSIQNVVRELLRSRALHRPFADLPDDLRLGPGGLGLDSIAVVELVLDCERRFGVSPMALLDGAPLTVGRLVTGLRLQLEMTR